MIQLSEPTGSCIKSAVLRLGGLHFEMSFLSSIGHLMTGSGFAEVLETIYATNSVKHMLTGKAISRAIRGHLLVYGALHFILIANAYNLPIPDTGYETETNKDTPEGDPRKHQSASHGDKGFQDLECAANALDRLFNGDCLETISSTELEAIEQIAFKIEEEKTSLQKFGTARLWLQYMKMVQILCKFVKAERTGNWNLHLQAEQDMLPYLAASGYNAYTKSGYLYLQNMLCLKDKHPDVWAGFQNGHHVIQRSDRYGCGLSTDLVIEQVLTRSVKSRGGLTRGRGMSEPQRLVWLLSMPACAQINLFMQTLTGLRYETSDQHKDVCKSRKQRDTEDTLKLLAAFKQWNPLH